MYEIVQLELIDLTSIEPGEAFAYVLEESSELMLVIRSDELPRRPAGCLVVVAPASHRPESPVPTTIGRYIDPPRRTVELMGAPANA